MEGYDYHISFKLCPSKRANRHLCPPSTDIARACYTGASSNSKVFVSFAYVQSDENFSFSLLNDLGRRSHREWAAASTEMGCFEKTNSLSAFKIRKLT